MIIKIIINSCGDCRHLSHSGAFTVGGAKSICSHSNAKGTLPSARERVGMSKGEQYHWKWRIIDEKFLTRDQPEWCPLKRGETY